MSAKKPVLNNNHDDEKKLFLVLAIFDFLSTHACGVSTCTRPSSRNRVIYAIQHAGVVVIRL